MHSTQSNQSKCSKEIERKFLIDSFPENLPVITESFDLQGYISVLPVVRIRKKVFSSGEITYILCFKGNGDLARTEIEIPLSKETFNELEELVGKPLITKEYKMFQFGDYILECSLVDKGTENEFYYAEIEFRSEEEANNFVAPDFLKNDITYDSHYKMAEYWRKTRL